MDFTFHALIAEDEPKIAEKIKILVEELNAHTVVVHSIPDMLATLANSKINFDILVLDRMMGSSDSADFVVSLRVQFPTLKIIILSAIDSSLEKAKLIDSGADDYLAKPFETIEFQARLKALIRRSGPLAPPTNYTIANINLDLIQRSVSIAGEVLNLTAKEFLVLHLLSSSIGKIYSRTQLIESIWGFSLENDTNVVESTVNSLRRKLEQAQALIQIKNTRYIGYWIEI